MNKTYFFLNVSTASLRALFLALLALTLILFSAPIKSAPAAEYGPRHDNAIKGSDTNMRSGFISLRAPLSSQRSTLASNYAEKTGITEFKRRRKRLKKNYLTSPPNITRGDINGTRISVTFDGGIGAGQASEILDILKKRHITTTIFLSGNFIKLHPQITRRIVAEGHEVGNHTTTHPHLTQLEINGTQKTLPHVTREFLIRELNTAEERFFEVTGRHMSPLWRAPYGEVNATLRAWAFSAGYLHIGWTYDSKKHASLDSLDWVDDRSSHLYHSAREIKKKILTFGDNGGHLGGGIVLMHLGTDRGSERASSILGEMLDDLLKQGLSVVKVSDLIVNRRLLREAALKKVRYYTAKDRSDKNHSTQRFKFRLRTLPLRG